MRTLVPTAGGNADWLPSCRDKGSDERAQLPHFWEFTLKEYLELDESTYTQLLITVLFVIAKCGKQSKSHENSRTDAGEPKAGGWQLEREQSVQGDIHRTH